MAAALAVRPPGMRLLLQLKLTLLRNRVRQVVDQSPLRLLLILAFVAAIWIALYVIFANVFLVLRRFEQRSVIAIPYVFHVFFAAMTLLLAFSTAVLVYGSLFTRAEPSFLLSTPHSPRNVVAVMYLDALFFASWSLLLLGFPLMMALGRVQGLPWHFYLVFGLAFLGFVPIPGALGLVAACAVALWLPRFARKALFLASGAALGMVVLWWGRLWTVSSSDANEWLHGFLGELQYLRAAVLPSTWVTQAIRHAIEDRPGDAAFYLAVTVSTALFLSWAGVNMVGARLLPAFARAHSASNRTRASSGVASRWLTGLFFPYAPQRLRWLILKDVRTFLRDPLQWSQLLILFGLLALYLAYLPRTRPGGFSVAWRTLICFLNFGAVTLILSTFTSRFVFPMMSIEGAQMWLVGLWPLPRRSVLRAKFCYALTVTCFAALTVTILSIRSLELTPLLAIVQTGGTFVTCVGLCGLAVGLGAALPSYHETNAGRIASGLGGTVNLIASVALVAASVLLFGILLYRMARVGDIARLDATGVVLVVLIAVANLGAAGVAMGAGGRAFERAQF